MRVDQIRLHHANLVRRNPSRARFPQDGLPPLARETETELVGGLPCRETGRQRRGKSGDVHVPTWETALHVEAAVPSLKAAQLAAALQHASPSPFSYSSW